MWNAEHENAFSQISKPMLKTACINPSLCSSDNHYTTTKLPNLPNFTFHLPNFSSSFTTLSTESSPLRFFLGTHNIMCKSDQLNLIKHYEYYDQIGTGILRYAIHVSQPAFYRHWRRSGVFIVNFEHISHLVLVFLLLTLNM